MNLGWRFPILSHPIPSYRVPDQCKLPLAGEGGARRSRKRGKVGGGS